VNPAKHIKKTSVAIVLLLGVVTQVHEAPLAHQKSDFSVTQTKRAPLPAEPQTISSNDAAETKSGFAQFLPDGVSPQNIGNDRPGSEAHFAVKGDRFIEAVTDFGANRSKVVGLL
jgi:hypothetical protein